MDFVRVRDNITHIGYIYEILKACGEDMFLNQGLVHWKTPYPVERISADCINKEVYVVMEDNIPVATFQLNILGEFAELSKFAVVPSFSGKGIGKNCLRYMEQLCLQKGLRGMSLDVYDQSKVAIRFYENNGFVITGEKHTRYFRVLLMEKTI